MSDFLLEFSFPAYVKSQKVSTQTRPLFPTSIHLPIPPSTSPSTRSHTSSSVTTNPSNSTSPTVALFHNGVRTFAPPPRVGDFVQIKIRQDDIDLGPPSATYGATRYGSKTSIHTCVILSVEEDHINGQWNPFVFLCRGFSYSPNPLEHIANMHPQHVYIDPDNLVRRQASVWYERPILEGQQCQHSFPYGERRSESGGTHPALAHSDLDSTCT